MGKRLGTGRTDGNGDTFLEPPTGVLVPLSIPHLFDPVPPLGKDVKLMPEEVSSNGAGDLFSFLSVSTTSQRRRGERETHPVIVKLDTPPSSQQPPQKTLLILPPIHPTRRIGSLRSSLKEQLERVNGTEEDIVDEEDVLCF
jgi:hypothetical protein